MLQIITTRVISIRIYKLILIILTPLLAYWLFNINRIDYENNCTYLSDIHKHQNIRIVGATNAMEYQPPRYRTILYWNKMFVSENFYFDDGDVFASCPVSNCRATNNRSYLNVEDFDVLMFHAPEINLMDLPKRRSAHQLYIFMNLETQLMHPVANNIVFRNYFNWTMTYRKDSDLMRPYGIVRNVTSNEVIPPHIPAVWKDVTVGMIDERSRKITRGKTKWVAWFVSNCHTPSRRELYVQKMQQHIPIDVYGGCGPMKCGCDTETECFRMVEKEYYFYLAFENTICNDYITEKAFKFLEYDIIPIVYGGVDYATVLPPNSYIDIMDFASPKELADYLWALSEDQERYLSFFKWKSFYKVETIPKRNTLCEMCKRLNEVVRFPQIVDDVYEWWTTGQCTTKPTFRGVT